MVDFQHWPAASGFLDLLKANGDFYKDIASTPYEVVEIAGSLSLRKYSTKKKGGASAGPILIVPSIINRAFVLDLLPEKSFIRYFLEQGHDVYLIDWGVPEPHEAQLKIEDVLTLHLDLFLNRMRQEVGDRPIHLVGQCLGGTIALILAQLFSDRFASITLITTPVSFISTDKLSQWARSPLFDLEAFTEAYGNIPWAVLQATFIALKPTQVFSKARHYFTKKQNSDFLRNFWAMEAWSYDNVDVRGEWFLKLLRDLYKQDSLRKNSFQLGSQLLGLQSYKLPTFVLIADSDHIVPAESHLTPEMVPLVNNFVTAVGEGGHIGAVIGRRSQKTLWPQLHKWLKSCEY